ncbi:MAG: MarR family transcriptional regulator [Rhodobacteraceae bacterium]|mgnify:FL=1|jgi:DNA-binding MarR family transcriptional regulator|nr:MarR family transcriptional regulator [Paracoccaceae bacterium]
MTKINDETLRTFVGYHLKRSFNVIQSDLIETLRPFDLRMLTYSALVLIVDNPGLNQSRLSQIMDIERPNLVVIIDELEERELITRERVPTDRRSYALHPTEAGRALYRETLDAVTQHEAKLLSGIAPEQLEQMIATLKLIESAKKGQA